MMLLRNLGICVLVLVLVTPLVAAAQEKVARTKTLEELTQDVQLLQSQLKGTAENLTKLTEQVGSNTQAIGENKTELSRVKDIINEEIKKQQELLGRIEALTNLQQEQYTQQQQILDSIAGKDREGNDVLRLSATMARSEEFREDLRKAVHESIQQNGEVVVHNRMSSFQWIKVNQTDYGIPAGEILTLKVPVGTVTAQLPGQRLTNWTVAAPSYQQKIDIVPEQPAAVTTYRPISSEPLAPRPASSAASVSASPIYTSPIETYYVDPVTSAYLPSLGWYVWPY